MVRTYILGAGSSVDFGYPLGKDIFVKSKELAYSQQVYAESEKACHLLRAFKKVRNGLNNILSKLPEDCSYWPNFEEIYSFITSELSIHGGPRVAGITEDLRKALKDMLFLMIAGCGIKPFITESELSDAYKDFFEIILKDNSVKIISFNYDALLPSALRKLRVIPDYGFNCYDMKNRNILNLGIKSVDLVVPHGAINIAECPNCRKRFFSADPFTSRIKNERAYCPMCKNSLTDLHLMPPSYHKYIDDDRDAKRIISFISESSEIYIFGYSFPSYDYYFKYLFLIGLANNPRSPKILIVDKIDNINSQGELVCKYGFLKLTSCTVSYYCKGFMDYIKGL